MTQPIPLGSAVRIDPTLDDLTPEQLRAIMPRCDVPTWHPLLVVTMGRCGIVTPARVAGFLAQVAHESGELRRLEEGLNYTSAERIMAVWPRRFPTAAAATPYVRAPEALADFVYGGRADLGNRGVASGDGWRYRGGGPIQVTGLTNYRACAEATGHPVVEHPELLRAPGPEAADSAGWFWQSHGCNELADACRLDATPEQIDGTFRALTRRINGGAAGLADRLAYWDRARDALGHTPQPGPVEA